MSPDYPTLCLHSSCVSNNLRSCGDTIVAEVKTIASKALLTAAWNQWSLFVYWPQYLVKKKNQVSKLQLKRIV